MKPSETREADFLEDVLPRYEAEGFEVYVNPSPSILPPFMQDYRPDAIALSRDKKIAIEVVRTTKSSPEKLRHLQSLFAPHREWELRVLYVSPLSSDHLLQVASPEAISDAIRQVNALRKGGHKVPALVMAWATLEALGRALLPEQFGRPQTPARLVEVLASSGYLTPSEADVLRAAISQRNRAVHGGLDSDVEENLLERFTEILQTLVALRAGKKA
jgi:REase_AHJR-like